MILVLRPSSGSRLPRAASRLLAALALVLSVAAPFHGLLHDHHHAGHEGPALHEAGHESLSSEADCPLCTLAGSTVLLQQSVELTAPAASERPAGSRAVLLASRQGAAAPARGPPAPTC